MIVICSIVIYTCILTCAQWKWKTISSVLLFTYLEIKLGSLFSVQKFTTLSIAVSSSSFLSPSQLRKPPWARPLRWRKRMENPVLMKITNRRRRKRSLLRFDYFMQESILLIHISHIYPSLFRDTFSHTDDNNFLHAVQVPPTCTSFIVACSRFSNEPRINSIWNSLFNYW